TLLIDIGRKKPTQTFREQVINEIPPSQYYLRANRIDAATGWLKEITIYDVGGEASRRIIYADSGFMAYAGDRTDLSLRLYDGSIHQYRPAEPQMFQLTYFRINDIRVKNVYDQLERNTSEAIRGDREMSTCEMLTVIREAGQDGAQATRERTELLLTDLRALLALPPLPRGDSPSAVRPLPAYCGWIESVRTLVLPKTAEAQTPAQARPALRPPLPPRLPPGERVQLSNWSLVATAVERSQDSGRRADRYAVEVHKKWAISLACVSFVIIGIVMALRFPRGGIGLVIGGGLLVFSVHYIGLTAGESLADRGHVSPWLAMWAPNIVLTIIGLLGLVWVSRESGSTRGGDFQELLEGLRHLVRWPWRRAGSRREAA
ncbi:MAG: LptF/LptG family permease, partial [Gemmatimonadales bacterium]